MEKQQLQVVEQQQQVGMITPAGSIDQTIEQFNLYQELKNKLGRAEDFQMFSTKEKQPNGKYEYKQKAFPKKSFVRKVQRFFNISCDIVKEEPLKDDEGKIIAWLVIARATHLATGAYQDGDGACSIDEKVDRNGNPDKKRQTIHNLRAHAVTRAKNRAILDLVGFGDVSAEEINAGDYDSNPQPTEEERKTKGIQMMYAEAKKGKGLSDEEAKIIIERETNKTSANDLTLEQLRSMYKLFKDTTAKDLKEVAKAYLLAKEGQSNKVYDVDPETGDVTEVKGGAA